MFGCVRGVLWGSWVRGIVPGGWVCRVCRVCQWWGRGAGVRAGGGVKIKMRGNTTNRSIDDKTRGGMFTINCVAFGDTFTEILVA